MNYLKKYLSLQLIVLVFSLNYAQTGSVCISEENLDPHASAMLQVSSSNKGVLFPRMSFEAATNIENKHNGLIVFITDSLKMGYWYWNAIESKWTQVRDEDTGEQDIEAPYGGIIMYSGEVNASLFDNNGTGKDGSIMQGWQICNGYNNSPNLTGRFIMGDTLVSGATGGQDQLVLTNEQMPVHNHLANPVQGTIEPHPHELGEQTHYHTVDIVWKKISGTKRQKHVEVRKRGSDHVDYLDQTYDVGYDGKIVMTEASGSITFSTSDLNRDIKVNEAGGGKSIENRPAFYVVLYLMRYTTR